MPTIVSNASPPHPQANIVHQIEPMLLPPPTEECLAASREARGIAPTNIEFEKKGIPL
jgi:hypothetical protein